MAKAARKKRQEAGPGYDGAEIFETGVRLSPTRIEKRSVRARPGTFEWRYNRDDSALTPLYHAGVDFAVLMERAGAAVAATAARLAPGGTIIAGSFISAAGSFTQPTISAGWVPVLPILSCSIGSRTSTSRTAG